MSGDEVSVTNQSLASRFADGAFRLRFWLHILIYIVAFGITWSGPHGAGARRVWLLFPEAASAYLGVSLNSAIVVITGVATLLAFMGAFLRTWGSAYLGAGVVFNPQVQSRDFARSGPFRHMRNPLYLGTIFHTLALCLLMSWQGAIFAIVAIVVLQVGLILSEERYLSSHLGSVYREYIKAVPRFVPRISAVANDDGVRTQWPRAFAGETYMWGTAISFLVFGSSYNALLVLQGVVVAFGLSLAVRGFMGKVGARSPGPA